MNYKLFIENKLSKLPKNYIYKEQRQYLRNFLLGKKYNK